MTEELKGQEVTKHILLQMAVKAINDTASPDGLVPTLLVFGVYPRMTDRDPPTTTITQRAAAIKRAVDEIIKLQAQKQVRDALNQRNGPSITAIYDTPINSPVLVWREGNTGRSGKWTGPYPLISIDGETCQVGLPSGPTEFRSTGVKPLNRPYSEKSKNTEIGEQDEEQEQIETERDTGLRQNLADIIVFIEDHDDDTPKKGNYATTTMQQKVPLKNNENLPMQKPPTFIESREKEINGLYEKGAFEFVDASEIPEGTRIFRSRFVDEIKYPGTDKAYEKSRLVIQAYNDFGKDLILAQSPTVQRVSQ